MPEGIDQRLRHILLRQGVSAVGEGAPTLEEKCRLVDSLRQAGGDARGIDRILLADNEELRLALGQARENLRELKHLCDTLTAVPWHIGVYLSQVEDPAGPRADILCGNSRRVIGLADTLAPDELTVGDEVYLNQESSIVVGRSSLGPPRAGETAAFDRALPDGRVVVRWRDEELVFLPAGSLDLSELQEGDLLRVDRQAWIAYEKVDSATGKQYMLDEVPDARPEQVGGQRAALEALLGTLTATLVAPEKAAWYDLCSRPTILLEGAPGCGKTLMARVGVAQVSRISGRRSRFGVVKPAEWENPYVGATQGNIRNTFKALHEAADEAGFAVLFLDEIEAVGRIRGSAVGHHSDKFLAALLAELDGFADRNNVAVIGATNRKSLCDPALLERFETHIHVGRPDMRGATEIFGIHLHASVPYSPNGDSASATRRELIDRAVSRLYSPNADNDLCTLRFRDGKSRVVKARELASGRLIQQICHAAKRSAFLRDVRSGECGLCVEDIDSAVADALERLSTTLDLHNAHAYLADLPQDVAVVAVDPARRLVTRRHHYIEE